MPGYNWHSAYGFGVLLVECKGCNRRAALRKAEIGIRMHQGNMREINREKFKCRACGGNTVRAFPTEQEQVDMFLAGDPVGAMRQAI